MRSFRLSRALVVRTLVNGDFWGFSFFGVAPYCLRIVRHSRSMIALGSRYGHLDSEKANAI